jgi:DNA-binding LytR/AlgR family response regulator
MPKPLKIAIVEDEMLTASNIQEVIEDAGYSVTGIADDANGAIDLINKSQPDLVMLDIHIKGDKDGVWLAEQINERYKLPFIFLTSFGDKASVARAVRTRPFGYLLKPFDENDIIESIGIALNNFSKDTQVTEPGMPQREPSDTMVMRDSIFVKQNNIYMKVNFQDILFIQADKNYVDILTATKKYSLRSSLKEMTGNLPAQLFHQVNRSAIVNLNKVEGYGKDVVLIGKHELSLSENYRDDFLRFIKTHKD